MRKSQKGGRVGSRPALGLDGLRFGLGEKKIAFGVIHSVEEAVGASMRTLGVDLQGAGRIMKVECVSFPLAVQEQGLSAELVHGAPPVADRLRR